MSFFGFGDVEILVIGALIVLFFGKSKVMEWYKTIKAGMFDFQKEKAKVDREIAAEGVKEKTTKATA